VITVLAGGIGAARFLQGLLSVHPPSDITIVSNVGDDAEFFGLHVSPDIDATLYYLSGLADEDQGFGLKDDSFHVLDAIARFGYDTWFRLGDADMATCLARTDLLRRGRSLSEATAELADALVVPVRIIPVTDDRLRTKIRTEDGTVDFQEYFVKRRTEGHAWEIIFEGADEARPAPGVLDAIADADSIILTPSNPLVSIGPILAVPGVREALVATDAKVGAISPIVGGKALKGPADRMLRDQSLPATPTTIGSLYKDFLDVMVIDDIDAERESEIQALGLEVVVTDTIMISMEKKAALARTTLDAVSRNS
jgi:LPPG:FO 2-phospho-L-lactate transferase